MTEVSFEGDQFQMPRQHTVGHVSYRSTTRNFHNFTEFSNYYCLFIEEIITNGG